MVTESNFLRKEWALARLLLIVVGILIVYQIMHERCMHGEADGSLEFYGAMKALGQRYRGQDPFISHVISGTINAEIRAVTSALWPSGCPQPNRGTLPTCRAERKKLMFVKVHKCASTTSASILLRFAKKRNLQVAAPKFEVGHIGWPSPFRPEFIWGYPQLTRFDVLAHHIVYDRCYVMKHFPKKDYVYLTILRHPFAQFKSAVSFFNELNSIIPKSDLRYELFLVNPNRYEKEVRFNLYGVFFGQKSVTKNMMATDLGFPNTEAENSTAVRQFIERLDTDFDLIMIADHMAESLVLLKRLMCWQLTDILHLRLNQHKYKKGTSIANSSLADLRKTHRKHSAVDYHLYDHFNRTLWDKIRNQSTDFSDEVKVFKKYQEDIGVFCSARHEKELKLTPSRFLKSAIIRRDDCSAFGRMPEDYTPDIWNTTAKRIRNLHQHFRQ